MKNLLLSLTLLFTLQVHAQGDQEPRDIQEFETLSVWLPFQVGLDGNISFFKDHPTESFVFSPIVQIGIQWKKVRFHPQERVDNFVLFKENYPDEWLEVYRRRLRLGAGLGMLIKKGLKLGLVPFKGANQRLVRKVGSGTPAPGLSLLPESLGEIDSWNTGDQGSFETFGGVQIQLSASSGLIDIASARIELQSEFLLQIKKISADEVQVGIFEGSSKRRRFSVGPLLANFMAGKFSGKRLGAEFILNISKDEKLYQKALAGELSYLQERLPYVSQRLSFYGKSSTTFFGIPEVIGKNIRKGEVKMDENGEEVTMSFRSRKNDGILLARRDIHRFIYLSDQETVLFWANEMSKVKGKVLDKYFLSIGRRMGLKNFDNKVDRKENFGNVMTQMGMVIRNDEIPLLRGIDKKTLEVQYKNRCEELRLNCRKERRREKIINEYARLMKLDFDKLRKGLGKLLMKNPSFMHSIFKTLKLSKEAYFLFLSDRFKSQEGKAEVQI